MNREEAIIRLYLTIDAAYRVVTHGQAVRHCGRSPNLTDVEAIVIEVFGEMQRLHDDAAIWRYDDAHWREWFPKLGSYKFDFRYNERKFDDGERMVAALNGVEGKRLTYRIADA